MPTDGSIAGPAVDKALETLNSERSISRRSEGVRHLPQADIESIRDVVHGYGSSIGVLKELIQNAEDAKSENMSVFYLPPDPTACQSLLRSPGLLVVNDGEFKPEHRDAIRQISLGTKGTEERSIGRFGKGLKSVFHWCEAFFIIARTDPEYGWTERYVADLFNPWHGWKHSDWDKELEIYCDELVSKVEQVLNSPSPKPWLALWFPLRQEKHASENSVQEWIEPHFPGDDPSFARTIADDLRTLAPSLTALRNLRRIAVAENIPDSSLVLEFSETSARIPAPDDPVGCKTVSGELLLRSSATDETTCHYCGLSGRLPDLEIAHLKEAKDWPKVVQDDAGARNAKGEPHFAALISSVATSKREEGSLNLRWSVFFPVGKQPVDALPLKLGSIPSHITVNLHGFFFLDSDRLRIEGLEEQFRSDARQSCVEWNRIVASRGSLACLPEALAYFAQQNSLRPGDCNELAQTFCRTWTWRAFRKEITQRFGWRPRWRNGKDEWELIPSSNGVYSVPRSHSPEHLLIELPILRQIEEELILVSFVDDEPEPGLYCGMPNCLPESRVLQLLGKATTKLSESTIQWINKLLNQLYGMGALTRAIRECAMSLPLLNARSPRSEILARITGEQWLESTKRLELFGDGGQSSFWIREACSALPEWTCLIGTTPPKWFSESYPPTLTASTAAQIVLGQTLLGNFRERSGLVQALASQNQADQAISLAIRFLLHGDPAHSRDTEMLFLPSTQHGQHIWSRLIKQLLRKDGGADSWRLLHDQWAPILSQQQQQQMRVSTIDASGAWEELAKLGSAAQDIEFTPHEWSTDDICTIVEGLFQVGQSQTEKTISILRRLPLHELRGRADERVSIADAQGGLSSLFILNTPDFERDLPGHLRPLWQTFLTDTHIIHELPVDTLASAVQRKLFRQIDTDNGEYVAQLDWNFVVRRTLDYRAPADRALLIMEALSRGDQSVRGLGQKLKKTRWIPLSVGGNVAPESVIHIDGLEDDLDRLLDPEIDGLAGLRALDATITGHAGFATLRNYLPRTEQAVEMLGLWLAENREWYLGFTTPNNLNELQPILSHLSQFETIPAATLVLNCRALRSRGYENGIDSLITEYLLPAVLKPFDYLHGGIEKIESVLHWSAEQQVRSAFDAYLKQACIDGKIASLLPRLTLANRGGRWRPANQLIWPSTNLDPEAQLCDEQALILAGLRETREQTWSVDREDHQSSVQTHQLSQEPNFDAEAENLREYLQPFRIGNVGENLPAALVAVLGGAPSTEALLNELLHFGIGMDRDNFLAWLMGDRAESLADSLRAARFLIEIVRGTSVMTRSVTGEEIRVEFTKEINSLIVGDPADLWFRHYYRSRPETCCHRLRLRWIQDPEQIEDCVAVFASTIELILLKVHCNGVASQCPSNLRQVLSEIGDAGQTNLKRSQTYLLDVAEARLRELGVRDLPQLGAVLQKFSEAQRARVDAKILQENNPAKSKERSSDAERLLAFAKRDLLDLLEAEQENATQWRLVEAVRRKMNDYQYTLNSIAFELFQNADDAVAEIEEMQNATIPEARRFVLSVDSQQRVLEVFHWGRPINHYEHLGFTEGQNRGYDQDLEKMLTLNFSDKGADSDGRRALVTGRFGLGFKSVFFLTQEPKVVSGRLAFRIKAGFFPVPLSPFEAAELRSAASSIGVSGLAPTAINLKWSQRIEASDVANAVDAFVGLAPMLPIFSRRIQTLTVVQDEETTTWKLAETKLTASGRLSFVQIGNLSFFCFRCELSGDNRPAAIVFSHDSSGISQLPTAWTGLWITTPTAERSDLRFALNAPFKPDAGRLRLAVNNPENKLIATEIAQVWGDALIELFDLTATGWDVFSTVAQLHKQASRENWWAQLWRETTRCAPATEWTSIQNGGETLGWIAWARPDGAMRRLVRERAVIPTELPGLYKTFVRQEDVRFSISGVLSETSNGCFWEVSQWPSTQRVFPPGGTVNCSVTAYLRSADLQVDAVAVELEDFLCAAIGQNYEVSESVADQIGKLLINCKALFEMTSANAFEIQRILTWMRNLKLLSKDGGFHVASELVCGRAVAGAVENDEVLRSAFAPDSAVLWDGYSIPAVKFFVKTRGQLAAGAAALADWARGASADKLDSVFRYLVVGELGQQVADQLNRPWLDVKRATSAWQALSREDQNEIERKFLRGYQLPFPVNIVQPTPETVRQEMDPEEAFTLVSDWWVHEGPKWISKYEEKTYPTGLPGYLPWPGEDEWDAAIEPSGQARWLMLFIHAALVPLGFNTIGRDQGFSRFLLSKGWLGVLSNVVSDPNCVIQALDEYLDSYVQNTQYHFQMRQFVAFYAVAKNLESLILSLRESDQSDAPNNFRLALSPRANPVLTGTGIDAPPLTGMLGIGSCQLLRELYRMRKLQNPAGYRFAFTPIRKVRRLCYQLFGLPEGPSSIESSEKTFIGLHTIAENLGRDATFNHCFDLPLQFLAQDRELRVEVLDVDFDVPVDDDDLDAAPEVNSL